MWLMSNMAGKGAPIIFGTMVNKKKAGDIILVALHFDAPGLPSYAIAIKSTHFTIFTLYDINFSSFCVT